MALTSGYGLEGIGIGSGIKRDTLILIRSIRENMVLDKIE